MAKSIHQKVLTLYLRRAHDIPVPGRSPSASRPLKVASRCFALAPEGRPSGPSPPPRAVAGPTRGRKKNGYAFSISDVYEEKSIYPSGDHGRGSLLAPGVFTPGTKPDRGPTSTHTHTYYIILCMYGIVWVVFQIGVYSKHDGSNESALAWFGNALSCCVCKLKLLLTLRHVRHVGT